MNRPKPHIEAVRMASKPPVNVRKGNSEYDTACIKAEVLKLLQTLGQYQGFIISDLPDSVAKNLVNNTRRANKIEISVRSKILGPGETRFWIIKK